MAKIKLAEALLRRKELQQKVEQTFRIKEDAIYEVRAKRINVTESLDDIVATIPKITLSQATAEYDHYAKQLRLVDAAIQNANWTTEIEVGDQVMSSYADIKKD